MIFNPAALKAGLEQKDSTRFYVLNTRDQWIESYFNWWIKVIIDSRKI